MPAEFFDQQHTEKSVLRINEIMPPIIPKGESKGPDVMGAFGATGNYIGYISHFRPAVRLAPRRRLVVLRRGRLGA